VEEQQMTALSTLKTRLLVVAITLSAVTAGCVSDYRGWLGHQTESEAKLWGNEASLLVTPDPDGFSGTYSPTVKYDFRGTRTVPAGTYPDAITIMVYRNPTVGAFSRDGCVDRDGDEVQQRPGLRPGTSCENALPSDTKFEPRYRFIDRAAGCQFFANFDQAFGGNKTPPALAVCFNSPTEEVDKDLSLQGSASSNLKEAFANLDDLFNKIWSGALSRSFTAEITGLTINGASVTLSSPVSLGLSRNDLRPINWTLDLSTPGGKEMIQALLSNTEDARPAALSIHFDGGMTFRVPSAMTLGFNHEALKKIL
jgi:hypothetical protein